MSLPSRSVAQGSGGKRRPNLFSRIADDLHAAITEGTLASGSQVPTRQELAKRYQTTLVTVQKALAQLESAGLVTSQGWRGTFVSATPPCLCRHALLLRDPEVSVEDTPRSLYHQALARIATERSTSGVEFALYQGMAGTSGSDLPALLAAITDRTLAGLICVDVDPRIHPELVEAMRVQRLVAVNLGPRTPAFTPWEVAYDHADLTGRALHLLAERGCRRPAIAFSTFAFTEERVAEVARVCTGLGQRLHLGHALGFDPYRLLSPEHWIRLLMDQPAERRPDGVFITDEHLTAAICRGLAAAGQPPGTGIPVVSHADLAQPERHPGLIRCGFDLHQALLLAVGLVAKARLPGATGERAVLPATFLV